MASRINIIRWYNVNKELLMDKENLFWLRWEKNKLFATKFYQLTTRKGIKQRQWQK